MGYSIQRCCKTHSVETCYDHACFHITWILFCEMSCFTIHCSYISPDVRLVFWPMKTSINVFHYMSWIPGFMKWTSHLHKQARYARIKYILFIAIHQLLWAFVLWFVDLLRSSFVVVRSLFDYSAGIVPDTGGCCDIRYPPGTHLNSSSSGQNGRHFADDIFKCFIWMKSFIFRFEIHWSLFTRVQLTIFQHWSR